MLCSLCFGVPSHADEITVSLRVDCGRVLRENADKVVGINLNYLRDDDANRPDARPLQGALKDMGVRWLRYPGGEKSDFHLWSQPPFQKPDPVGIGWYGTVSGQKLDFDQFVADARAIGAQPYIVVGYDSFERTKITKEQWIENAVSWVRYANIVRGYGITHWEIGNENWHNNTAKPDEMASIVVEFSRAMKAVDPTIRIGASGNSDGWWAKFLPIAAPHLDFLSLSLYNTWNWKSYDYWLTHPKTDLLGDARVALNAIDRYAPAADRERLKVVVAETNSKDFSPNGWPGTNTLGHALVTFETLGQLALQKRMESAMVWTTRWVKDSEAAQSQWYALGPENQLLPTGRAIALWGQFVQENMVAVEGQSDNVRAYASCSAEKNVLVVWLVNRSHAPVKTRLSIASPASYRHAQVWHLSGTGPDDSSPKWEQENQIEVTGNALALPALPAVSATVIELRP